MEILYTGGYSLFRVKLYKNFKNTPAVQTTREAKPMTVMEDFCYDRVTETFVQDKTG